MIRVTLVLALGLVATMMLRRQSAALRHRVLAAAIACAALMPLAQAVAPAWQLPLLPVRAVRLAPPLALGDAPERGGASASGQALTALSTTPAVLPALRTAWLFGAGSSLLLLAVGIARLVAVASRARPVPDARWTAESAALAARYGLKRPPAVLQTSHPTLLFTWGLRQPRVLVPRDAGTWHDDRVRIVLGHELAHIRRGDWAVQLAADCVRSAYWFNPLVWVACWRLRLESEHACDDAVLGLGVAAPDYASQLLDLARAFRNSRRSFFPAPAMARPSDLERRVRVMLNTRMDRSPVGRLSGWLIALALVALTVPIAGLSLSAAPPAPAPAQSAVSTLPSPVVPAGVAKASPPAVVDAIPRPQAAAAVAPRSVEHARPAADHSEAGPQATFGISVVDQLGRSVPNVPVRLSNTLSGQNTDGLTDQSGEFKAADLPAGGYQLTVSKPGFKTVKQGITFADGQMARSRVTLQLGMLAETVIVNARAGTAPAAVGAAQPGVATPTGAIAPQARRVGAAPADDPCAQSTEGGCLTQPRKLVHVNPIYPAGAQEAGISGTVVVNGRLGIDGRVVDMQPGSDADQGLASAATQAIRLWEFSPTRLNGVPQEIQIEVTVTFAILKK